MDPSGRGRGIWTGEEEVKGNNVDRRGVALSGRRHSDCRTDKA